MVSQTGLLNHRKTVMSAHLASNAVAAVLEWLAAYGESH